MSIFLKSLEISGFKSFGTRTYIEFSEGITGIVGPNGCGKSNVIESIKWVLGEQSAKSLRGDKMQDIIFAGTRHRSGAGMSDVSLTFNNDPQWLPLEFPEISIGRRIFRSGEGQYFVNGIRSRLKDTTELFLDTGVGRDSYAIFEQGKIDRLLSESAEERRILFEDFAGISKFKFRKEEAEKKLAHAKENLNQLQQTIDRMEKEIESLEIQAADAENYNQLNNELRDMEIKFEAARIANMNKEIYRRQQEIVMLKEQLAPASDKLSELENQIGLTDEDLHEKELLFGKMNEKYINLQKQLTEANIKQESAKKNLDNSKARLQEMDLRTKQDKEKLEEWEDHIQEKRDALAEAEKKQSDAKNILDKQELKQNELKNKIQNLEDKLLIKFQDLGFKKILSRDDIEQMRRTSSELHGQIFIQESEIIRLEEDILSKNKHLQVEQELLDELKNNFEQAEAEKNKITNDKTTQLSEIKNCEQELIYLEQEYKNILNESKECDKKILTALDYQIEHIKRFQTDLQSGEASLKQIISDMELHISEEKIIDKLLFQQLKSALETQDSVYRSLLDKMFGKDTAFSEKIELSDKGESISQQIQQKKDKLQNLRLLLEEISQKESIAFQKLAESESFYKSSQREFQKIEKSTLSCNTMLAEAKINFEKLQAESKNNSTKLQAVEQIIYEYENSLHELRQQNHILQEDVANARINFKSFEMQVKGLGNDITLLEERRLDLEKQIKIFENDRVQLIKTIKNLEEELEDLLIDQDELNPELARLQEAMKQNAVDISELKQAKKIIEQTHKDTIEQFTKLRMRESEIEGALFERRKTLDNMIATFEEQFKTDSDDIALLPNESVEFLNGRIRQLREKLNQMGNVNLLAIEQFQETKESLSALIYQKEDIETAATDTERLINDANKESADRFLEAFEKIRKSFKTLFFELFNGGRADLILKDKINPLHSGIDIMAEPPGQKFQNISLLSGGQRAMVAIAVIFSILELKPTPFVILDEMDAPLDDENIDRFKRLLVRFKGKSQFVIVSHSKSTLEVCDVLFGVTMEELGCSKVVSVAFDDTENLLFVQ
ncbi:MAG: chromosome segregation SMC family protein [Brevinemataceae bacterium]